MQLNKNFKGFQHVFIFVMFHKVKAKYTNQMNVWIEYLNICTPQKTRKQSIFVNNILVRLKTNLLEA